MLSLRIFRKRFANIITTQLKFFGAKKEGGYTSSGISEKEVDKTKKPIPQGGLKSDSEKKPAKPVEKVTQTTSPDVKVIKSVPNHKV
jgi:hypothetical protein